MAIDDATLPASVEVACKKAAKDARKMMLLTVFAVAVAILVLAIDNGIKRAIISEAQKIKGLVARFEEVAGGTAAVQDGAGAVPADGAADAGGGGVAGGAAASAGPNGDAPAGRAAGAGRKGGRPAGP